MKPSHKLSLALAAIAGMAASQAAMATLTISGSVGGAPTGVKLINFDDLTPGSAAADTASGPNGSVNVSFTPGPEPIYGGIVAQGSVASKYAAPFVSGSNGTGFGNAANAADSTPYLTTGKGSGTVTIDFTSDQQYVGLLWGSVDSYNTLELLDSSNTVIGTVTGSDVTASPNGNQGVNGTLYVNINSTVAFRKVRASSTSAYAFEFDNVAYNETVVVPEPSTYVAGGLALLPLLFGLRSRFMKK